MCYTPLKFVVSLLIHPLSAQISVSTCFLSSGQWLWGKINCQHAKEIKPASSEKRRGELLCNHTSCFYSLILTLSGTLLGIKLDINNRLWGSRAGICFVQTTAPPVPPLWWFPQTKPQKPFSRPEGSDGVVSVLSRGAGGWTNQFVAYRERAEWRVKMKQKKKENLNLRCFTVRKWIWNGIISWLKHRHVRLKAPVGFVTPVDWVEH